MILPEDVSIKIKLEEGEDVPQCQACSGILKPNIVFFSEILPEGLFEAATERAESADLFMVIGSTLIVHPAADIPARAYHSGAKLVIINLSPTSLDYQAAVLIRAKAGETMAKVINQIREKLAKRHKATIGCPITTGIFASIAARAAAEELAEGKKHITPYWRTLKIKGEILPLIFLKIV